MGTIAATFKKEFRAYFNSPIAYIFITVFLILSLSRRSIFLSSVFLPFSSKFPPRFCFSAVHKIHDCKKDINHTGIMFFTRCVTKIIIKLVRVFADQVLWLLDTD